MGHLQAFLESGKFGDFLLGENILSSTVNPNPDPIGPPPVDRKLLLSAIQKGGGPKKGPGFKITKLAAAEISNADANSTVNSDSALNSTTNDKGGKSEVVSNSIDNVAITNAQNRLTSANTQQEKAAGKNLGVLNSLQLRIAEEQRKIEADLQRLRDSRRSAVNGDEKTDEKEWSDTESDSDEENAGTNTKDAAKPPEPVTATATTLEHTKNIEILVNYYLGTPKSTTLSEIRYNTASNKEDSYLPALNNFLQNMVERDTVNIITARGVDNYLMRSSKSADPNFLKPEPATIIKKILNGCFFIIDPIADDIKRYLKLNDTRGFFVCKNTKDEWLTALPTKEGKFLIMKAYQEEGHNSPLSVGDIVSTYQFPGILEYFCRPHNGQYYIVKQQKLNPLKRREIDAFNNLFLDLTEEEKAKLIPTTLTPPPTIPKSEPPPTKPKPKKTLVNT